MRRRPARRPAISLAAIGVLVALGATNAPTAAAAESPSRYSLAGTCQTLEAGGVAIGRSGPGYAVGASPERFYMKATALGSYLLFGSDRNMIAAASPGEGILPGLPGLTIGDGIVASPETGPRKSVV